MTDMPSGALGIWNAANFVSTPRKTVPNSVTNGTTDQNLLYAPRRAFSLYSAASLTIVDANTTAPDGSADATTITSSAGVSWNIHQNVTALPAGTYTAAISVKSLSGGSASFKFGKDASDTFVATTSWQRFIKTFTIGSLGADIKLASPDGTTAANFAICDFQLFAGSADLNANPLTQPPLSVQNSDLVVGISQYDSSTVSGLAITHGSISFLQFMATQSTSAFTMFYVAKRIVDTTGTGSDVIVAKPGINGATWQDFSVGPDTQFHVGSFVNDTAIDKTPAGITQLGSLLWAPLGKGPAIFGHRYDGAVASAFINGVKLLDNSVAVAAKTFEELYVGYLGVGSNVTGCDIYALVFYPMALTDQEIQQATLALTQLVSIANPRTILFEGTSITAGVGGFPYPYFIGPNLNDAAFGADYAIGGSSINSLVTRAAGVDAAISGSPLMQTFILSIEVGVNDLGTGNVAGFLSSLSAYLDARRAAGWKIVCHTILARNDAGDGGTQFNLDRASANATIRTWTGVHCDAVADWAADPTIGTDAAPNNATLFNTDKIHPTSAGHVILEPITRAAINSIGAAVQTGPGGIIVSHTFTRKRWKELRAELEAKEKSKALKRRADRMVLAGARIAADAAIQEAELAGRQQKEAIQADMERMEAALVAAASARSVATIIENANKAVKLAEAIQLQLEDDEEEEALAMLMMDS